METATPNTEPETVQSPADRPTELLSNTIVLPRPMRDAPLDGTHILAHNGDEYFPPVVVHFFGGSWYVSKWPDDCDNIYFPLKWWPLPQWQNAEVCHLRDKKAQPKESNS